MTSLWTDDDHSAHPWVAARPEPPVRPHDPDDEPSSSRPLRFVAVATACAIAALAGAVFEVLR